MIDLSDIRFKGKWEKRWHPLRREWVVYAAHRNSRPWSYEPVATQENSVEYDPSCYLCPGNKRVSGLINPKYEDIFIFDNDHPVVGEQAPDVSIWNAHAGLFLKGKAYGKSRVVSYHPRHDLSMSSIPLDGIHKVFLAMREQVIEFNNDPDIKFVLIFENRGEIVGVSNPHPHCQIYATNFIFSLVQEELDAVKDYQLEKNRNLFHDIIKAELEDEIRIIAENERAVAFIPFFARYAYEVMIFPKKRHATFVTMEDEELHALAEVFQQVTRKYDMNYNSVFPYVMSVLQAPIDGKDYESYHLHLLIQPPLRQPGLKKFLAGPEIGGGNFMADTIPEEKAAELRAVDVSKYIPGIIY